MKKLYCFQLYLNENGLSANIKFVSDTTCGFTCLIKATHFFINAIESLLSVDWEIVSEVFCPQEKRQTNKNPGKNNLFINF